VGGIFARKAHLWALGLALVITIATGFAVYHEWQDYSALEDSARLIHLAIESRQELLSLLKDAETGQRGYLLTGDPRYLEPYATARPQADRLLAQMSSRGELVGDAASLRRIVSIKFLELERTIGLRRAGKSKAALEVVETNEGKATMDTIRQLVRRATDAELAEIRGLTSLAGSHATQIRWIVLTGSVIVTLLLLVSTLRFHRLLQTQEVVISELDHARRDIEREKELFETTLRSIGDAVIATDELGHVRFMNAVAQDLTGWVSGESVDAPSCFSNHQRGHRRSDGRSGF